MDPNSVPAPNAAHQSRGYGAGGPSTGISEFGSAAGNPIESSPLSQSVGNYAGAGRYDDRSSIADQQSVTVNDPSSAGLQRTASSASSRAAGIGGTPSRSNTLTKKGSVKRTGSLKRSGSRRSMHAGSMKGLDGETARGDENSVFHTPIPTQGSPTDILANRFTAWRKFLKDLINYFREVQASYEARGKALLKVSNIIGNTNVPSLFLSDGGINEANSVLREYHKHSLTEVNKARDIENDVINQLNGLRQDLAAKIKEIKSLSGDFKNNVEKEKDNTRKAVAHLQEAIAAAEHSSDNTIGKDDPYVVRLGVDRQVEKQIDEENYLHRAYLNLEHSGRELESIVVGEVQKAYNALASILKREADEGYDAVDRLRSGPIMMPKDHEWSHFVRNDPHFVSPDVPLRRIEDIEYPGKHHTSAAEVRAGMLERKSKYLKSYTPGWYVLSPTHLHEFKSADRIYSQPPVMSLYLPDQKLGSHSQPGSSSHKFALKGRQTGRGHTGHNWVFRAETYDTMMAWYDDIQTLTTTSPGERDAFVRKHQRSMSASSQRAPSISGESGMEEDEADAVPYSANASGLVDGSDKEVVAGERPQRPQPGGRFPSEILVTRDLRAPLSPSSGTSDENDSAVVGAGVAGVAAATAAHEFHQGGTNYGAVGGAVGQLYDQQPADHARQQRDGPYGGYPEMRHASGVNPGPTPFTSVAQQGGQVPQPSQQSILGEAAGGAAIGAAGGVGAEEYWRRKKDEAAAAHQHQEQIGNEVAAAAEVSAAPASAGDATHTAYDTAKDGQPNAVATGRIIPVLRHDTSVTVSDLHVPGEFPAATPAATTASEAGPVLQ